MGDYQRLQTDAEAEILPPIEPKVPRPLCYKILFVSSTLFTVVVVIIFLWGLPCDLDTCNDQQHSISWDNTLYGLELKGRMHLVGGHLVCILRTALWGKPSSGFQKDTGGVIALAALTGKTVWWVPLTVTPIHIDCTMLGNRRCLVLGDNGYLTAVDYVSGIVVWRMSSRNITTWPQPEEIDFPLTVPGRGELITLSRFKSGQHRLLFVSMDSGLIESEPPVDRDCSHIYNLTYSSSGELHYTCTNRIGAVRIMTYELSKSKSAKSGLGAEPVDYSQRQLGPGEEISGGAGAGEHKVTVTNRGSCPTSCQVSVLVTDASNKTVWEYAAERTYVMLPLPLRFRPHITGFLIKLWQWHDQPLKSSNGITVELIGERIVLITFNKSGSMHVVNASQTDITQLCYAGTDANQCQPQLSFQTQSALLVDVNGDGQQDLISYFVTYRSVNEDDNPERVKEWELQSKVKVVRLEAELPKLYDAVSKH